MRQIKFRAWDKKTETMIVQLEGCSFSCRDTISNKTRKYENLMQFIGVTDIVGVEIYEGDIVEFGDGEEYTRGKIKWDTEVCGFVLYDTDASMFRLEDEPYQEMKVIGHIYKNTELLNLTE